MKYRSKYPSKRLKRGVPSGYKHIWKYHNSRWDETKQKDGSWNIRWRATKSKRSRGYGQFKKGFKILWGIKALQKAVKTGKGRYQTEMIGKKKRLWSGYKIPQRIKRKYKQIPLK